MNETLRPSQTLTVTPHVERGWYHLDRFDAHLDGDLVVTSRQPQLNRARALLDRGHHSETLLTIRHHGKEDSFVPRPIGELATCTYEESDRDGIKRRRWSRGRGPAIPLARMAQRHQRPRRHRDG
jgi:hypothetical protein